MSEKKSEKKLASRVQAVGASATMVISNRARELRAQGESVISFGAGEPDFPTPDYIVKAAVEACGETQWHKYSATPGLPELRTAIAEKTKRDSGLDVTPEQVVVTCGGKHAVYNSFQLLVDPGDEVIIVAPYWTTYPEAVILAGGTPKVVMSKAENNFLITPEELETVRTKKTVALVFVSPCNPTGVVYPKEAIEAIGKWAVEHGIWVITDEIYEHLTYDGHEHHSLPVVVPEAFERCIVVNGVAKTYAMTGWRIGWLIATKEVAKTAGVLQSHQTSNMPNIIQVAAAAAVSGPLDAVADMREAFDRRRLKMYEMLNEIPGVSAIKPQGAFYAFPSFEERLKSPIAGNILKSTQELSEVALNEAKVALVPGEAFGAPGYCRFSFALGDDDLVKGITRLAEFLE